MVAGEFKNLYDNLSKNISELKDLIKNADSPDLKMRTRIFERIKYLYYSIAKAMIDIGHGIVLENDYRDPRNRADVFISLAEHDIIMSSSVPGVKKSALVMNKINQMPNDEIKELVSSSVNDIQKCLDSFQVYFDLKDKKF
jgi:uncharacterized protein YutE (UPF0331/DUF86 family)